MIDDYWADEEFKGVEIHEVRLPLHPGDWFSQNIGNIQRRPLNMSNLNSTCISHNFSYETETRFNCC